MTEIELLPSRAELPTWGDLRVRLEELGNVQLRARGARPMADAERLSVDGVYTVVRGGEELTGFRPSGIIDEFDIEALLEEYDLTSAEVDAYRSAGYSYRIWVRPNGAWRALTRALHELAGGVLIVDADWIEGLEGGLHRGDRLPV